MASILKVDDLRGNTSAGDITITSEGGAATMQLQQGLAKAWVRYNGTGTVAIADSFGMSSLSDIASGYYELTLSNAMGNANYSITGSAQSGDSSSGRGRFEPSSIFAPTTTKNRAFTGAIQNVSAERDTAAVYTTIHGDLA
jgi:hypothetical protein